MRVLVGDARALDERYLRPTEVDALIGDAGKAREMLGWETTAARGGSPGSWSTPTWTRLRNGPLWIDWPRLDSWVS